MKYILALYAFLISLCGVSQNDTLLLPSRQDALTDLEFMFNFLHSDEFNYLLTELDSIQKEVCIRSAVIGIYLDSNGNEYNRFCSIRFCEDSTTNDSLASYLQSSVNNGNKISLKNTIVFSDSSSFWIEVLTLSFFTEKGNVYFVNGQKRITPDDYLKVAFLENGELIRVVRWGSTSK